MRQRVVVTGVAALTAAGDASASTAAVLAEVPARPVVEAFPAGLPAGSAPVVRIVTPTGDAVGRLRRPFPDRLTLAAISVTDQALRDAGLDGSTLDSVRSSVVVNTCFCASSTVDKYLRTLLSAGPDQVSPIGFARTVANAVLGEITRRHGILGPGVVVVGSTALGYAADLIAEGRADIAIAVGVDCLSEYTPWVYATAGMLGDGMILSEGAAAVVLESATFAAHRGRLARAEVAGFAAGFCAEAVQRVTDFTAPSIEDTMRSAIESAAVEPGSVDVVVSMQNGHSGLAGAESAAICSVFTSPRRIAPKLTIGETFGSSEVAAAIVGSALVSSGTDRVALINSGQIGGALSSVVLRKAGV